MQSIAKDMSLFSAVLRELGQALEKGQQSQLFRPEAYSTSLAIVKECEGVFAKTEGFLKKNTNDRSTLDEGASLSRMGKIKWPFRKSRVKFLQSQLASLKSTILLELDVLYFTWKKVRPSRHSQQVTN